MKHFEIGLRSQSGVVYKASMVRFYGEGVIIPTDVDTNDALWSRLVTTNARFIKVFGKDDPTEEVLINIRDIANIRIIN